MYRTNAAPMTLDNVSPHDLLDTLEAIVGASGRGALAEPGLGHTLAADYWTGRLLWWLSPRSAKTFP